MTSVSGDAAGVSANKIFYKPGPASSKVPKAEQGPVSIWKDFGSVCLLCLKTKTHNSVKSDLDEHNKSRLACVKYVALVSKYLRVECDLARKCRQFFEELAASRAKSIAENNSRARGRKGNPVAVVTNEEDVNDGEDRTQGGPEGGSGGGNEETDKFVLCEHCLPVAESFSKSVEDYELLRLQIQRRIYEATKIVERSNMKNDASVKAIGKMGPKAKRGKGKIQEPTEPSKDGSGGSSLEKKKEEEEKSKKDILLDFRDILKTRGERSLKSSFPHVNLKRSPQADDLLKKKKMGRVEEKSSQNSETETSSTTAGVEGPGPSCGRDGGNGKNDDDAEVISSPGSNPVATAIVTPYKAQKPSSSCVKEPSGTEAQQNNAVSGLAEMIRTLVESNPTCFENGSTPMIRVIRTNSNSNPSSTGTETPPTPVAPTITRTPNSAVILTRPPSNASQYPPASSATMFNVNSRFPTSSNSSTSTRVPSPMIPPRLPQQQQQRIVSAHLPQAVRPSPPPPIMPPITVPISEILRCNINNCGMTFSKTEQGVWCMHSHFRNTHSGLPCSRCAYISKSPFDLIKHEAKDHAADSRASVGRKNFGYYCSRCYHWAYLLSDYQEHFFLHHLNTKVELLKCPTCKKGFSHLRHDEYKEHVAVAHSPSDPSTPMVECMMCRVVFRDPKILWNHLKVDHGLDYKTGPLKCPLCPSAFHSSPILEFHKNFICKRKNLNSGNTGSMQYSTTVQPLRQSQPLSQNQNPITTQQVRNPLPTQSYQQRQPQVLAQQPQPVFLHQQQQQQQIPSQSPQNFSFQQVVEVVANPPLPQQMAEWINHQDQSQPQFQQQPQQQYIFQGQQQQPAQQQQYIVQSQQQQYLVQSQQEQGYQQGNYSIQQGPSSSSSFQPVIVSVASAVPAAHSSTSSSYSSSVTPSSSSRVQYQEPECKTEEQMILSDNLFFDEGSNDYDETMVSVSQAFSPRGNNPTPAPEEDPFGWLVSDDFD